MVSFDTGVFWTLAGWKTLPFLLSYLYCYIIEVGFCSFHFDALVELLLKSSSCCYTKIQKILSNVVSTSAISNLRSLYFGTQVFMARLSCWLSAFRSAHIDRANCTTKCINTRDHTLSLAQIRN